MILFGVDIIFSLVAIILLLVAYKADLSAQIIALVAYAIAVIVPLLGFIYASKSYHGSGIKDAKIALLIFVGAAVVSDALSFKAGWDWISYLVGGVVLAIELFYFIIIFLDYRHPGNKGYHAIFGIASIIIVVSALACIGYVSDIVEVAKGSLEVSKKIYGIIASVGSLLSTVFLAALYRSHYLAVKGE